MTTHDDDPAVALQLALEKDDREKALGSYRLLEAADRQVDLGQDLSLKLAELLEQAEMFRDAARIYRVAAEKDLKSEPAPAAIFRSALLLLGPAHRPQPGADMLLYLVANYPGYEKSPVAEKIHDQHMSGDAAGLAQSLLEEGVQPPHDGSAVGQGRLAIPPREDQVVAADAGGFAHWRRDLAGRIPMQTQRRLSRVLGIVFLALLCVYIMGRFMRDRFQGVTDVDPSLHFNPLQKQVKDEDPIQFRRGDYNLTLKPLYIYKISGLIVSINDYAMLGLRYQDFYELDLCMIWGNNVRSGAYRSSKVSFEHHGNTCYAKWSRGAAINGTELSNTHVYATDQDILDELDDLRVGDQIELSGFLVEVAAVPARVSPGQNPGTARLRSSTVRTDKGNGACEIMYAESLTVLSRGNVLWRLLAEISFWLLLLAFAAIVARLILLPIGMRGADR
ncbi:tol-pal system YbgF family protein [Myxococcota bacterium]